MKIAFLSTRQAKPSFRFRVEKMLPYFTAAGHQCETFFLHANPWQRLAFYRKLRTYDVVFLQKRLLSGPELLFLRRSSHTLIYDLDDSVMYDGTGGDDKGRRRRFSAMMRAADLVICGNQFLADEAARITDRVRIVPTCIDTEAFHPRLRKSGPYPVTIGWTGSHNVNAYSSLNDLFTVFSQLQGRIGLKILTDIVEGLDFSRLGKVPWNFVRWTPAIEIEEAATFDIGIMPLPDNRFTQGKCGFKALQYLALGIPAVCSPVGVNRDIIHDGVDGYLAQSPDQWFQVIARLVKDPFLRGSIGNSGRRCVEEEYSIAVHGPRLVRAVTSAGREVRKSA